MIVKNVFSNLIITVFGLEHALARVTIADFGEFCFLFLGKLSSFDNFILEFYHSVDLLFF